MSKAYRYGHSAIKGRHTVLLIFGIVLLLCGAIVYAIWNDISSNADTSEEGATRVVGQVTGSNTGNGLRVSEPFFTMQLPSDWKETERKNNTQEQSITWHSTKKGYEARWIKLYIDKIPTTKAVNRLLPVTVTNSTLTTGDVSENCSTFTQGGTLDAQKAVKLQPMPAKWQGIDFICNLPEVVENEVGVAATGGINQIEITGPNKGTHKYFFVYTEHNIQQDYAIAKDIIETFKAL